jgi:elongation factor P
MINASDVKAGMALRIDDKIFKVLEAIRHTGSGQMHGFVELKLKDMRFGHFVDRRFKHTERFDEVELVKRHMEFLYADAAGCWFMDPNTFEQVSIPKASVGHLENFMKEGMPIAVELIGDEPVAIQFPHVVEMKIVATGSGIRGGQDNTMKAATLENGVEILVPQFVETGELVRVDTEKLKYIDRVMHKKI